MLDKIDLSKKMDKKTYEEKRDALQTKLGALQRECKAAGMPVMIIFEGMGAAGKGVQINALIQALDPRSFESSGMQIGSVTVHGNPVETD